MKVGVVMMSTNDRWGGLMIVDKQLTETRVTVELGGDRFFSGAVYTQEKQMHHL